MSSHSAPADLPPVEIIGPFSVWPRHRSRMARPLTLMTLASIGAALAAHCVLPLVG